MERLIERRLGDFLRDLSAPAPTPGGGSAAATAAAMGAALLAMVAGLPKTRSGDPAEREALDAALPRLAATRDRLALLVDRDTTSYDAVTAAYKRPRGSDEQRASRSAAVQEALRGATEVPLEVMRACRDAAGDGLAVVRFGNPSARSDAAVGFELLRAGLRGAAMNVRANLGALKDAAFVSTVGDEADRLESALEDIAAEALRS